MLPERLESHLDFGANACEIAQLNMAITRAALSAQGRAAADKGDSQYGFGGGRRSSALGELPLVNLPLPDSRKATGSCPVAGAAAARARRGSADGAQGSRRGEPWAGRARADDPAPARPDWIRTDRFESGPPGLNPTNPV